jgi:endonuclease/exonuclease/phosphatase family metal-dependent hydrolase
MFFQNTHFNSRIKEGHVFNLKSSFFVCLLLLLMSSSAQDISNHKIRVMTFNIRVNVPSDSMNAWPYRKDIAESMIRFHHADIVGTQEAQYQQVHDLAERLPHHNWFGVGRDDGAEAGEFMAIFYLKERFKLLNNATFWLSENPEIPSKGWDAACNRIVTWGQFKDLITGKRFYFFNTHFDHKGGTARVESAKLLLKSIEDIAGNSEAIVTGDFNATPNSIVYKILTQNLEAKSQFKLIDTQNISRHPHHGPSETFIGFNLSNLMRKGQPIDYIFVTENMIVLNHGTLSDTFDGRFPSDHLPVLAEVVIR